MATLEVRGNSIRVSWRLGGARSGARQSCTFSGPDIEETKAVAETAKRLVEARGHNLTRPECYNALLGTEPEPDAPAVPTFAEWVETYVADRERLRDIQPDVIKGYRSILRSRAVPFLGHHRLTDISPDTIRDWVAWLSSSRITMGNRHKRLGNRVISPTTVRRVHAITHACLSAAVPKWLPVNPAARPPGASKHSSGLPRKSNFKGMFLTADEVALILGHCSPKIRDMAIIMHRSGLRLGEIIALRVCNVVFDRNGNATIRVREGLKNDETVGEPKSESSVRDVTLGAEPSRILAQCVKGRRINDLVFQTPRGGRWDEHNFRDRYWWPAVAAAMRCSEHPPPAPAKPVRGPARKWRNDEVSACTCPARLHRRPRPHDLRHTHASDLIALGWHARKIQGRLGHSTYQITMNIYGHLMNNGSPEELEDLDALHAPAVPAIRLRERGGSVRRPVRPGGVPRLVSRR